MVFFAQRLQQFHSSVRLFEVHTYTYSNLSPAARSKDRRCTTKQGVPVQLLAQSQPANLSYIYPRLSVETLLTYQLRKDPCAQYFHK